MKQSEIKQKINKFFTSMVALIPKKENVLENLQKKAIMLLSLRVMGLSVPNINIRNLHNIIFASPSKSRIRNLQSIGRGLRLKDNNTHATLYDVAR